MAYVNYPKCLPFKMIPRNPNPDNLGIHGSWACEQIRDFEIRAKYKTKWVKTDITLLQIEASLPPEPYKVLDKYGAVVKSFAWATTFDGGTYKIYQITYDISDLPDGTYFNYGQVKFGLLINLEAISEPILSQGSHINTRLITFKNSFNKDDVAWTTGITMKFRCECDIQDYEPDRDRTSYVNQVKDTENLDGVAMEEYQFYVGDTKDGRSGVAPYIVDILNKILVCDYIKIGNLLIQSKEGSNWKITRVRGFPLIGAAITVVEASNKQSLQQAVDDGTGMPSGRVNSYNIETGFFGPVATIPVTEILENS